MMRRVLYSLFIMIGLSKGQQYTNYMPTRAILENIISTEMSNEVLNVNELTNVVNYEWNRLSNQQTIPSPFIVCVGNGRVGVENLMNGRNTSQFQPLVSNTEYTCYIMYTTFDVIQTLPSTVSSLKYMIPYSSLFKPNGVFDTIYDGSYFTNTVRCQRGLTLSSTPGYGNVNSILTKIQSDLSSGIYLAIINANFYWKNTNVFNTRGQQWIDSLQTNCSFSNIIYENESPYMSLRNLCDLSPQCLLTLLAYLMTLPSIYSIELSPVIITTNIRSSGISQGGDPNLFPIWNAGLLGDNQIAQIMDTGFNNVNCYFTNAPNPEITISTSASPITDNTQRKVIQYVNNSDSSPYNTICGEHGTHCAGTVGGYNVGTTIGVNTYNGIAPNAKLMFWSAGVISGALCGLSISTNVGANGFSQAYNGGARVFSNSWGTTYGLSYQSQAVSVDSFMYTNTDSLVVFSAGNSADDVTGLTTGTVISPATSKNCVSVGASQSTKIGSSLPAVLNLTRIAYFSSIGPTVDGRLKPDIIAPGQLLVSANYNSACGTVALQGTSMACPNVAGSALLIRQYFTEGWYPTGVATPANAFTPTGALLKAMIVNSGVAMLGMDNYSSLQTPAQGPILSLGPPPNIYQGFGRLQLDRVLRIATISNTPNLYVDQSTSLATGNVKVYKFGIPPVGKVFRSFECSLVWTDPPGSAGAATVVLNNLDLSAVSDANTRRTIIYPNGLPRPDNVNNVEKIRITTPVPNDVITVTVTATSVSVSSPQNYAFVVSGTFASGAYYCQDPRVLRPDALYRTENCRIACPTGTKLPRNPICCRSIAGNTCVPGSADNIPSVCTGLIIPTNC